MGSLLRTRAILPLVILAMVLAAGTVVEGKWGRTLVDRPSEGSFVYLHGSSTGSTIVVHWFASGKFIGSHSSRSNDLIDAPFSRRFPLTKGEIVTVSIEVNGTLDDDVVSCSISTDRGNVATDAGKVIGRHRKGPDVDCSAQVIGV